jgi:hypothetical protein
MRREDSSGALQFGCMSMHQRNGAKSTVIPAGSLNPDRTGCVNARTAIVHTSDTRFGMYREDDYAVWKCQSRF